MKIKGLTLQQIEDCAQRAGHFKLDNVRQIGNYTFFVLRMASSTPGRATKDGDRVYPRPAGEGLDEWESKISERMRYRKRSTGRMLHGTGPEYGIAVCFHGFRAFMRECFKVNPYTIIRTARAAYLGSADFEAKWSNVGTANVGSAFYPISYSECCDC